MKKFFTVIFLITNFSSFGQTANSLFDRFYGIPFSESKEEILEYLKKDTLFFDLGVSDLCVSCDYSYFGKIVNTPKNCFSPDSAKIYLTHPMLIRNAGNLVIPHMMYLQIEYYFQSIDSASSYFNSILQDTIICKIDSIANFNYKKYFNCVTSGRHYYFPGGYGRGVEHLMTINFDSYVDEKLFVVSCYYNFPKSLD